MRNTEIINQEPITDDIKAGEYGTFMFPEDNFNGYWRIQTDNPGIISKMRKIARDNK